MLEGAEIGLDSISASPTCDDGTAGVKIISEASDGRGSLCVEQDDSSLLAVVILCSYLTPLPALGRMQVFLLLLAMQEVSPVLGTMQVFSRLRFLFSGFPTGLGTGDGAGD